MRKLIFMPIFLYSSSKPIFDFYLHKNLIVVILGLAPMDGITDCAYRYITKRIFDKYNKNPENELYLWTEFMNVHGYLINPSKVVRHMLTIPTTTKTIAQIYGGDQDKLLESALKLEQDYGDVFYAIELNIGCPSPKVMAS
ncbi:MAG: hypothetical protein GXP45_04615 [bacterium]|nr:hypothetical protein [bacterium]